MKKYMVMLSVLTYITSYAANGEKNYSNKAPYRVPLALELIEPGIENSAYTDFLRVIDEANRNNPSKKTYINKNTNNFDEVYEGVDIVPIAQYGSIGDDDFYKNVGELSGKKISRTKDKLYSVDSLVKNWKNVISKEEMNDLSYKRYGSSKRFYFGNGNTVKDIIIKNKDEFAKDTNKNNHRYYIDGVYEPIAKKNSANINPLGVTLAEYNSNIQGKSKNDPSVLKFLQGKLKAKNIDAIVENNELWTKDKNGKKHRVLWSLEPVSIPNESEFTNLNSNKRYENTILSNVYTFNPLKVGGRVIYTNEGDIIVEDPISYDNNISIRSGYNSSMTIDKIIENGKKDPNSVPEVFKEYFNDLKKLNSTDFDKKWGKGFENDEEFKKNLKDYQEAIGKVRKAENENTQKLEKTKEALANIEKNPKFPSDYYEYTSAWNSEEKKEKYLKSLPKESQKLVLDYVKLLEDKKTLGDKEYEFYTEINDTIPKKYGFYNGWKATEEEKKWISKMVSDRDIIVGRLGKNIEFRGKGRVEGTIDLGAGENYLTITEQSTGKFGTNITFGPNVKLRNIKAILVGGQINAKTGAAGISGKTSLSMEVDPNKVDKNGYLYQHALKDTWVDGNKIIFSSTDTNYNYRNDFGIELKVSSLGKDSIIDMGRSLEYKAYPLIIDQSAQGAPKSNDIIDYKITLFSDSIAHQIYELDKKTEKNNSLVKVKVLDKIKRLSSAENEVYKSIKDSGDLGFLTNTISSSTKKTIFSAEEDMLEKDKMISLARSLQENNTPLSIVKNLSHFDYDKKKEDSLLKDIEELKRNPVIVNFKKQNENLEKYKKLNYNDTFAKINSLNLDSLVSNGKIVNSKQFDTDDKVLNKIKEIQEYYKKNIKNLYTELDKIKPQNTNEDVKEAKDLRDTLQSIEFESTSFIWNGRDKKLSEFVEKFDKVQRLIKKIQEMDEKTRLEELSKDLVALEYKTDGTQTEAYKHLRENLYYTQREEESLRELKILLSQLQEKNIYSEVNKISKNEIDVFTPLAFNTSFDGKSPMAKGGAISGRFSKGKFKGNIYTAYGIYEFPLNEKSSLGLVVGGGSSDHKEVKNDTLKTVTTESKIKGTRAYLGAYNRYKFTPNLEIITGVGAQYGKYDVDRDFRNNYQQERYKGKVNTTTGNIYSGVAYTYKFTDTLDMNLKGGLSYVIVNQGKAKEDKKPLSIEVKAQNFNYLDGEVGLGLTKKIFSNSNTSTISGGVYGIYGIVGYDNDNLKGKINNSSSTFNIKGNSYKKESVKVNLDYNVYENSGLTYGIEGTYIKNADEDNISVGVKAGYKF